MTMKHLFSALLILISFTAKAQPVDTLVQVTNFGDIKVPYRFSGTSTNMNDSTVVSHNGRIMKIPQTMVFNKAGLVNQPMRIWADTVQLTTASGQSIDISSAGFTQIIGVSLQVSSNTSSASSAPSCSIKSWSTTSVTINVLQANNPVVSALGIGLTVLQFLQSTTGVKAHLVVFGY